MRKGAGLQDFWAAWPLSWQLWLFIIRTHHHAFTSPAQNPHTFSMYFLITTRLACRFPAAHLLPPSAASKPLKPQLCSSGAGQGAAQGTSTRMMACCLVILGATAADKADAAAPDKRSSSLALLTASSCSRSSRRSSRQSAAICKAGAAKKSIRLAHLCPAVRHPGHLRLRLPTRRRLCHCLSGCNTQASRPPRRPSPVQQTAQSLAPGGCAWAPRPMPYPPPPNP